MKQAEVYIPSHFPGLDILIHYRWEEVRENREDCEGSTGMLYIEIDRLELQGDNHEASFMSIHNKDIPGKLKDKLASAVHALHYEQLAERA